MTTTIRTLLAATLLLAACGGGAEPAAPTPEPTPEAAPAPTPEPTPAATFDGKSFQVTVTVEGQAPAQDTFKFDAGTFESAWGVGKGFAKANYTLVSVEGGAWKFTADAESAAEGKGHWEGTLVGDNLTGEMTQTKGETTTKVTFAGTATPAAAPAADAAAPPAAPAADPAAAPAAPATP
jgi:hypothetical protein